MNTKASKKAKLMKAIERYVAAVEADSWKGSGDPDAYGEIEDELGAAKKHLSNTIDEAID